MKANKHFFIIILILLVLLVNVILFAYPVRIDRDMSIIKSVPTSFWVLILILSGFIVFLSFRFKSKILIFLLSVLFYFSFYCLNLLFITVPEQTDISATSMFMHHLSRNNFIDPLLYSYFNYPIYFSSGKAINGVLGLSNYGTINLGFFLYLLSIPFILPLTMVKFTRKFPQSFIIYPSAYLITTFFFINSQFIPQFVGLIFLMLTIGSYVRLRETKNVIYYFLTMIFFILCVYSHPFMFLFFFMAVIIQKTTELTTSNLFKMTLDFIKTSNSIWHIIYRFFFKLIEVKMLFKIVIIKGRKILESFVGIREKKQISIILLMAIYLYGYITRFHRLNFLEDLLNPIDERGETWSLLSYFLGSNRRIGIASYENYPLYDIVSSEIHLLLRYVNMVILFIIIAFIAISIMRVSKKHINIFDISIFMGAIAFMVGGFLNAMILGQRAVQIMFINTPQYLGRVLRQRRIVFIIIAIMISSPILFNLNYSIMNTISGFNFIEDNGSMIPGEFIEDHSPGNQTVFVSFRSYYPIELSRLNYSTEDRMYREIPSSLRLDNYTMRSDLIIKNDKIAGNLHYWGIQENIFDDINNTIYDQGDGRILIRGSKVHQ